jgi:hypothetical protein
MLVKGDNLGDTPGKVVLHLTDWKDKPKDVELQILNWGNTFAAGKVPPISEVFDQQGAITVVAQCGAVSNPLALQFTATVDVVDLAYADVPPDHWHPWYDCSMSSGVSDHDACQNQGSTNFPQECTSGGFTPWESGGGVGNLGGYHDSGWGFTGNSGNDQFWLAGPLNNGWVLLETSAEVTTQVSAAGQNTGGRVWVDNGQASNPGISNPRLGIDCHINNCGAIFYTGHMFVTGPLGVPY